MSNPSLLILPGDGIGPEVMAEVRKVIDGTATSVIWALTCPKTLWAAVPMTSTATPLADDTMAKAQEVDAVLLGAVGGPKYDDLGFQR